MLFRAANREPSDSPGDRAQLLDRSLTLRQVATLIPVVHQPGINEDFSNSHSPDKRQAILPHDLLGVGAGLNSKDISMLVCSFFCDTLYSDNLGEGFQPHVDMIDRPC